jgi:hypothetical protein
MSWHYIRTRRRTSDTYRRCSLCDCAFTHTTRLERPDTGSDYRICSSTHGFRRPYYPGRFHLGMKKCNLVVPISMVHNANAPFGNFALTTVHTSLYICATQRHIHSANDLQIVSHRQLTVSYHSSTHKLFR